jgi:hypothetical protein
MESVKCPICKQSSGFDIIPNFQTTSEGFIQGFSLYAKCKNAECKKEFPLLDSKVYDKIDKIWELLQELRGKQTNS